MKQLVAIAVVAVSAVGFALWSAGTSSSATHALTVVGIQPRSGQALAVDSNAVAELRTASAGNILIYGVADPGAPVGLESTACSPNDSLYACQKATGGAMHQSMALAGRLAAAVTVAEPLVVGRSRLGWRRERLWAGGVRSGLRAVADELPGLHFPSRGACDREP
jgi:hypothetical protein